MTRTIDHVLAQGHANSAIRAGECAIAGAYTGLDDNLSTTATNSAADSEKFVKNVVWYGRHVAENVLSTISTWLADKKYLSVHFPTELARTNLELQCTLLSNELESMPTEA